MRYQIQQMFEFVSGHTVYICITQIMLPLIIFISILVLYSQEMRAILRLKIQLLVTAGRLG